MTLTRESAMDIVQAYTERQILDNVMQFLEKVPQAMEYAMSHELADNPVFLKFHAFGLVKNEDPVLKPLFDDHMIEIEMRSKGGIDIEDDLPEY